MNRLLLNATNGIRYVNKGKEPCHIIEIQYGEETSEDDIERLKYYDGELSSSRLQFF